MGAKTETTKAVDETVIIPAGNTEAAMIQAKAEEDKAIAAEVKKTEGLTETAAIEEARAKVLVEQSGYSTGELANSTYYSTQVTGPAHPNDVQFEVTDPKDTGMPKGITIVSKEVAEQFKSLGLGKIVK